MTLNEKIALALGIENRHLVHDPDEYSTDSRWVGDLLLEAQKRGWTTTILNLLGQKTWQVFFDEQRTDSHSLPEAVCKAFVAAHEAQGKEGDT